MLVFTVAYAVVIARVGFAYGNAILVPSQEDGSRVYSGKIQGKRAQFTVSADKIVEFQYGDQNYGPYTAREDPSAISKGEEISEDMVGMEIWCGEERIFRGGMEVLGEHRLLYDEDGNACDLDFSITDSNGITMDGNGNVIDPMEPTVPVILDLMAGPALTHKGDWLIWFDGVLLCLVTAFLVLFGDKLFRLHLMFQIKNAEQAEPSDWELKSRRITWSVMAILTAIIFGMGLG